MMRQGGEDVRTLLREILKREITFKYLMMTAPAPSDYPSDKFRQLTVDKFTRFSRLYGEDADYREGGGEDDTFYLSMDNFEMDHMSEKGKNEFFFSKLMHKMLCNSLCGPIATHVKRFFVSELDIGEYYIEELIATQLAALK